MHFSHKDLRLKFRLGAIAPCLKANPETFDMTRIGSAMFFERKGSNPIGVIGGRMNLVMVLRREALGYALSSPINHSAIM